MGRSLQQPRIRNRAATPDTANTARPADTAGHAAASVVKAGLKPSAGRALGAARASLAQTRFEKIGEGGWPSQGRCAFAFRHSSDQQRGNGNRATANKLERCTPLISATRAVLTTRGPLLHPKSSFKENPAQ